MASTRPLLEGQLADPLDLEVKRLREKIAELKLDLQEAESARDEAIARWDRLTKSAADLMHQLFGASEFTVDSPNAMTGAAVAKWDAIKRRLTPKQALFIDLLLVQGPMTVSNLAHATHCSGEAARQTFMQLRDQGLVTKEGDKVVLRG